MQTVYFELNSVDFGPCSRLIECSSIAFEFLMLLSLWCDTLIRPRPITQRQNIGGLCLQNKPHPSRKQQECSGSRLVLG